MKKYFSGIVICCWFVLATAYEPARSDFINEYQYRLYLSWNQRSSLPSDSPAEFLPHVLKRFWQNEPEGNVRIEYDWQNYQIHEQRQIFLSSSIENDPYLRIAEILVYRLNAADSTFLADYLRLTGIRLQYKDADDEAVFDRLNQNYHGKPLRVTELSIPDDFTDKRLNLILEKADTLAIFYPEGMTDAISFTAWEIDVKFAPLIESGKKITPVSLRPDFLDLSLSQYLEYYIDDPPKRELLQNKIKDVEKFLVQEFPDHQLVHGNDHYRLSASPWQDVFGREIRVKINSKQDGIEIIPENTYKIENRHFHVNDLDRIELITLEEHDIDQIAPYIPQLLYEHRSIGSKLLNFLLIHDNVPTTLVLYSEERKVFELDSYADLLLLLNNCWQNHQVYFSLHDFRKMNSFIEFKGILIAASPSSSKVDMAEIWFHLDKQYKLDLIMMILYPDKDIIEG